MTKLYGEVAILHAAKTRGQLYYRDKKTGTDRPLGWEEDVVGLCDSDPGGISCEALPPGASRLAVLQEGHDPPSGGKEAS